MSRLARGPWPLAVRSRLSTASAVGMLILIAGCTPSARRLPRPSADIEALPSANALLDLLAQRRQASRTLRATAKVELTTTVLSDAGEVQRQRLRTTQAVLAAVPSSFRLEAIATFGISYVLACNGPELALFVPSENTLYRGSASPDAIARSTGIALAPSDITSLLLGVPPITGEAARTSVSRTTDPSLTEGQGVEREPAIVALELRTTGSTEVVGFALERQASVPSLFPVTFARLSPSGEIELQASFAGEVDKGLPQVIEISTPGAHVVLRYQRVERNIALDSTRFSLPRPAGAIEKRLDAVDAAADAPEPQ